MTAVSGEGQRISEYFSLGTVMEGLSDIFNCLFGVRLVPTNTLPGELCADDVQKLAVMHETEVIDAWWIGSRQLRKVPRELLLP